MNLESYPINSLSGEITCPGDKSISQRILIIGSLLNCDIKISGFLDAEDPNSTMLALNNLGASIKKDKNIVSISHRSKPFSNPSSFLDLGNSGTGMRLLTGFISGLNIEATLIGDESLSKRPMLRVVDPLTLMGKEISTNSGKAPIQIIGGNIKDNFEYVMPIASAQVKSSLMLASLSSGNSIKITEPKITRDHTEKMIEYLGGSIEVSESSEGKTIFLKNSKLSKISTYEVVGDFSSAAFIIVAALISKNSEVLIKNVGLNKTRSGLLEVLLKMNANIEIINKTKTCNEDCGDIIVKSSHLEGINVPNSIIPNIIDEIPILSVAASFAEGQTIIKNASELKVKESDRLHATSMGLKTMNIKHDLLDDGLIINGTRDDVEIHEEIESFGDHRIAMSFLIAGLRSKNGVKVRNCSNIETSFPNFSKTMNNLGMNIND
ncbi:MAG: 3-phosphoshikimate 1-carboxyvinyltransferase [Gammaproteobacteria bacterium]